MPQVLDDMHLSDITIAYGMTAGKPHIKHRRTKKKPNKNGGDNRDLRCGFLRAPSPEVDGRKPRLESRTKNESSFNFFDCIYDCFIV